MTNQLAKHIVHVPNDKKAVAPYNFVELPDKVVEVDKASLRSHDRYYGDRYTGKIECTLTTSSPLYIRCGYTLDEYADFGEKLFHQLTEEQKSKRADFFKNPSNLKPVIPGSSLRGMLRTLVEIITFSKIDRVSGQNHFYFRAVAAEEDDPLKQLYSDSHKDIKAGYLKKDSQDQWFIVPAKEIRKKESFISVKEQQIKNSLPSLITMEKSEYLPQYIPVSVNISSSGKITAISEDTNKLTTKGHLVTCGNMLETSNLTESERLSKINGKSGRKKHYVVLDKDETKPAIYIEKYSVDNYCNSLTNFQNGKLFESNPKNPFNIKMGLFDINRPIFYCQPTKGKLVTLFGQSPNFRIPFLPKENGEAATSRDFIPAHLKDPDKDDNRETIIDIAEAIFGYVRGNKSDNQSRSGRVSVSDAKCKSTGDIWHEQEPIIPQILASPKPTTFQHYLVQKEETKAEKPKLKHYAHKPVEETVIRGHKLYWHKGSSPNFKHQDRKKAENEQKTQITKIKPIKTGVSFEFTVHFENLSNIELGALLWVLDVAQDDQYRLSLGMGKPLGMGAVKIEHQLYLSKRQARYESLFANQSWKTGEELESDPNFMSEFENDMAVKLEHIGSFKTHHRIKMLLSMLKWQDIPKVTDTRYMEIERENDKSKGYLCQPTKPNDKTVNEYKCRLVLPSPLDVRESDRKRNYEATQHTAQSQSQTSASQSETSANNTVKFKEGDVVSAKVTKIEGSKVSYELSDGITKRTEDKCKQASFLSMDQDVQVKVSLKEDGSVKKLKYFDSKK